MFTKKEKKVLELVLRNEFDFTIEFHREIISISKKLQLSEAFVSEMEADYEFDRNNL